MKKNHIFGAFFALVFASIIGLFALGLGNNPNELDLATKDSKISAFSLPSLLDDKLLSNADLVTDKRYFLVNFWGSWCPSCYKEHSYLMQLGRRETIYGVNWKDERSAGLQFIRQGRNPYKQIIIDDNSVLAIGMGVYGAPETFLVKADGTIMYRHAGPINKAIWQKDFVPKIKALGDK